MPRFACPTRRHVVLTGAIATGFGLARGWLDLAQGQTLPPTPACGDHGAPTLRQTEGPFYKPRSPRRTDLYVDGMGGQPIEISGLVLTRNCRPLAGALIDVWQADAKGRYDNNGFRLRGHQYTGDDGRFRLRTVVPGAYPGRTRHMHVKVQAPSSRLLTTQLYFPGEAGNRSDPLFRRELMVRTAKAAGWLAGRFDFVLDVG